METRSKSQTQTEYEGTFKETDVRAGRIWRHVQRDRHRQNMKARSKRQTRTEYEGTFKETDTDRR